MSDQRKYVIQKHQKQSAPLHWDLMLETLDGLETYRLNSPPEQIISNGNNLATKIFTHDKKFLTYQGPVNKGTGSVEIADSGNFEQMESLEEKTTLKLKGQVIKGFFEMVHVKDEVYSFNYLGD